MGDVPHTGRTMDEETRMLTGPGVTFAPGFLVRYGVELGEGGPFAWSRGSTTTET